MSEMISHPQHYNAEGRKECIVEMLEKYGFHATANFALLNAYKYLYRMGLKDGNPSENDFKKAQWYFDWVTEKASELDLYGILDTVLYNDIWAVLEREKELPWVTVGNWEPIEAKQIGNSKEKIEVTNFEPDWEKNLVCLEDDCK